MTDYEQYWLRDALNLATRGPSPYFEDFAYNHRPLFFYVEVLNSFSPHFHHYYREIFRTNIRNYAKRGTIEAYKNSIQGKMEEYFQKCKLDSGEFNRLNLAVSSGGSFNSYFEPHQLESYRNADHSTHAPGRVDLFNKLLGSIGQSGFEGVYESSPEESYVNRIRRKPGANYWLTTEQKIKIEQETKQKYAPKALTPAEQKSQNQLIKEQDESPYGAFVKDLEKKPLYQTPKEQLARLEEKKKDEKTSTVAPSSLPFSPKDLEAAIKAEDDLRVLIADQPAPTTPPTRSTEPIRNLPPQPASTNPAPSGPAPARRGDGGVPNIPGLGNLLGRGGASRLAAGTAGRAALAGAAAAGAPVLGAAGVIIISIFAAIALMVGLSFLKDANEQQAILGIEQGRAQAAPIGGDGGSISHCQFTRGDLKPPEASFKSSQLLGYFEEVSQKTTVPATVLAGIARVETPGSVNWTDEQAKNGSICPESGDGALGLMQLVSQFSHRTDAFCRDCIAAGAAYLGKTVDQLTRADYCDPRTNIYMGAGFVLKKLQAHYKLGDGTKWDPEWTNNKDIINKVANTFYGCLGYPSCQSGPFNYGDDVWKSVSQCKPINQTPNNQSPNIIADASCPIPGGKIGCASYGKPESWGGFSGSCRADSTGNGGHCNQIYQSNVGICTQRTQNGNLIRTAKSIDVAANTKAGDPVYLPAINGKPTKWKYDGLVSAGGSFGWIRLFKSVDSPEGVWSIHLLHVNSANPQLLIGDIVESGKVGATILSPWIPGDNWPHIHITVGLDVGDSINDLKDYSPNWKFADRDLGMCTK